MAKLIEVDPASVKTKSFKNWLQELAETEMVFNILNRIRAQNIQEMSMYTQATQANTPTMMVPPDILKQYTEILKDMDEPERSIALSIITSSMRPSQVVSMDPNLMLALLLLKTLNTNTNNKEDPIANAIKGQYEVLAKIIEKLGDNNNNNNNIDIPSLINSLANLVKAQKGEQGDNSIVNEIARKAIEGLVKASTNPEEAFERQLEFIRKLQESGILPDPQLSYQLALEKYKIDREYEFKKDQLEYEKEQMERASEFLRDIVDAIDKLTGGEGEEEVEKERPKVFRKPCPKCGNEIDIEPGVDRVECPSCGAKIKVKWPRR